MPSSPSPPCHNLRSTTTFPYASVAPSSCHTPPLLLLTCYPSFPPTFLPPLLLLSPRPAPLSSPKTPLALLHPLTSTSCTYPYVQPSSSPSSPPAQACKPSACAVECRPPLLSLPHPLPLLSAPSSPEHNPPRSYSPLNHMTPSSPPPFQTTYSPQSVLSPPQTPAPSPLPRSSPHTLSPPSLPPTPPHPPPHLHSNPPTP